MTGVRAALAVARHELAVLLRAPVAYGVGALFLVVQGLAFAAQVAVLSDPSRPAPVGAVLHGYFAGSLLTWTLWLAVLGALATRAVTEPRRTGGWELLVTAPVGDGAAVLGSWLAATCFQILLWLPTAAYLVILAGWSPTGAAWDWGPVITAYLGMCAVGGALLALALAAAATTTSTLLGGAAAFALLLVVVLVGELGSLWPGLAADHPVIAAALDALSVRARVDELARGEITVAAVVLLVGLTAVGLAAAGVLVGRGRRRRRATRLGGVATLLVAISAGLILTLAVRHPRRWDVTAGQNRLDPATEAILAALPEPATLTIVRPALAQFEPIYAEVERVLARMPAAQPGLTIVRLDAATVAGPRLARLASEAGLAVRDLGGSGAVVVQVGVRRRVLDLLELAELGADPIAAPAVTRLDVEAAVAARLRELSGDEPWTVCVATGHGEATLAAGPDPDQVDLRGWDEVGRRLRADGAQLVARPSLSGGLDGCAVVVVAGARAGWSREALLAFAEHLRAGGSALIALDAELERPPLGQVTGAYGIEPTAGVAEDPAATLDDEGRLRIEDGYGPHPISAGFPRRRVTVWRAPTVLALRAPAVALIQTGASGRSSAGGRHGPQPFAAAAAQGQIRLVVLGSADLEPVRSSGAGPLWATQAIRWLARREQVPLLIADRTPPVVRLQMTVGERRAVTAMCVAGVPLVLVGLGLIATVRRRRRGRRGGAP